MSQFLGVILYVSNFDTYTRLQKARHRHSTKKKGRLVYEGNGSYHVRLVNFIDMASINILGPLCQSSTINDTNILRFPKQI